AGCDVVVPEVSPGLCEKSRERTERSLARQVDRGKLEESAKDAPLQRLAFSTGFADQADRHLVIEAVRESEALKRDIFGTLDQVTPPETILASNTSSIPITRLAAATDRPERVVGLHFFNPVPVMGLVELVVTPLSAPSV